MEGSDVPMLGSTLEAASLAEATGTLKLEMIMGRTVATRSYAKYPLKFMVPAKVAQAGVDAVWVFVITYGGGILAGDVVSFSLDVGPGCTGALTTQASTKIYHSADGRVAEQVLTATVASGALLALLPDPVTCFRDAIYVQKQTFKLQPDSSLVFVDWLTSGRRERGEVWAFQRYTSSNKVLVEGAPPLLLDTVHLEQGAGLSVGERMQGLHGVAMVFLYGPRSAGARAAMEAGVRSIAEATFRQNRATGREAPRDDGARTDAVGAPGGNKERMFASCSQLGSEGLVVRVAGPTTEAVYRFLRANLASLTSELGAHPYGSLG